MSRFSQATIALLALIFLAPSVASAQSPATFTSPAAGAELASSDVVRWTSRPDALAYYLYVGTAPGLKNLIDSGETPLTEWSVRSLPVGVPLFARIHTKYPSGWANSSVEFSVRPVAEFTNPANGSSIVSPDFKFEWQPVPGAQAYYLYVGSASGRKDLVDSRETGATFFQARNLPLGEIVHARLHTKHGGQWRFVDLALEVSQAAAFRAPLDGEMAFDPSAPLRWNPVPGAQAYYLYVGTSSGAKDLIDSRETQATQWPATFIPAGVLVYARLHTKQGGVWRHRDIAFRTKPLSVFIEPEAEGEVMDSRASLMWTDVPQAQAYYLYVGSAPGRKDIVDSRETLALSHPLATLPRGQPLYASLFTKSGGVWRSVNRSFALRPAATLLPPPETFSRVDTRLPLRWNALPNAQAYYLYVGTTPGARDLIDSRETQATQWSISTLPAGATVFARLFTKSGGVWSYVETTITTKPVAYLNGSVAESGIWQVNKPLTWASYAGASRYYVYVGTAPGLKDISSSGETSGTQFTMPVRHASAVTGDRTVYVRMHSLVSGRWEYVDYILSLRAVAQLTFPRNDLHNVDVYSLRTQWTNVTAAEGFRLQIGTTPGSSGVFDSGELGPLASYRTAELPGGTTLYARLSTKVSGEWRIADTVFTTRPAAAFTNPALGQIGVSLAQPLAWTSVAGADKYRVALGTAPGETDIVDSGEVSTTFFDASMVAGHAAGIIYGRVWARHGGVWRFSDTVFFVGAIPDAASMAWESGPDAFNARDAFNWSPSPLAASYRLRLGTSSGSGDLHDSGLIHSTRRLVDGLPAGTRLYGSVETTFLDGTRVSSTFDFTVQSTEISFADRWNHAMAAAADIRAMANSRNVPLPNSILLDAGRLQLHESSVTCTDYAVALLELLPYLDIGVEARPLGVCFNTFDCHKLVEAFHPSLNRWVILDPTFGLSAKRVSDGTWASALDLHAATRDMNFAAIEYVPFTGLGTTVAESYYLDYPLLYADVYATNTWSERIAEVTGMLPYFELTGSKTATEYGRYSLQCRGGSSTASVRVTRSGLQTDAEGIAVVPCESDDENFTEVFLAETVSPADDSQDYELARPRRFVFD